jgi:hypothetical protein
MSEENDNTSSGCFNTLGIIFILCIVVIPGIIGLTSIFLKNNPEIAQSVKTKSLDENTIKQHLIGKKLRNSGWTFASLNEFEHFEIESVSTDENQDKTYIIKSVLKDWKSGKRYNSRFYIKYDKIQGQSELADFASGKEMILDVWAYSYELIVPEKDLPSENDNTIGGHK